MRWFVVPLTCVALAGCGTDTPNNSTAAASSTRQSDRDAAQAGRVFNPDVFACLEQVATDEELAALAKEDVAAQALLAEILRREAMDRCMRENNVTVYL